MSQQNYYLKWRKYKCQQVLWLVYDIAYKIKKFFLLQSTYLKYHIKITLNQMVCKQTRLGDSIYGLDYFLLPLTYWKGLMRLLIFIPCDAVHGLNS